MDIETMPHATYFTGDSDTVTKINQVPYQTIEYNDNGMFTAKLMNDTPIGIFIDNGATPSILPLRTYVTQLRSGEDPELQNTLKNASYRGGQAAKCFKYSPTEGDGGVRAIRSSPG